MISDLCDELRLLHAWVRVGFGVVEAHERAAAAAAAKLDARRRRGSSGAMAAELAAATAAEEAAKRAADPHDGAAFGTTRFPASMGQAEQAAWTGLVRSICREDAATRTAVADACVAVNATLTELLLQDLSYLATRSLLQASRQLLDVHVEGPSAAGNTV